MTMNSNLVLDNRIGVLGLCYRDVDTGVIKWAALVKAGTFYIYNMQEGEGEGEPWYAYIATTRSRWQVDVIIAEQEGTYANQQHMLTFNEKTGIVKIYAPWMSSEDMGAVVRKHVFALWHYKPTLKKLPVRAADGKATYYKVY